MFVLALMSGSVAMEKEKKLDSGRIVAKMQTATSWTSANRRLTFLGRRFQTATSLAKMPSRSYLVSCCKRLSSLTVRTMTFFNQPRLRRNPLCSADWLCLRGIARCKCAILPIREIATCSRCSVCEQISSGSAPRRTGPCRHRNL